MSVTINAKGTSVPQFTIGKTGVTLYQGTANPYPANTLRNGDYWLDKSTNSLKVWNNVSTQWDAPRLADIRFISNEVAGPNDNSLILAAGLDQHIRLNSTSTNGTDQTVVTTGNPNGLNIKPSVAGGAQSALYLNDQKWPAAAGSNGQVLSTNSAGMLSWITLVIQKLSDIADVSAPAPVSDGSMLVFENSTQKWTATTTLSKQTIDGGDF